MLASALPVDSSVSFSCCTSDRVSAPNAAVIPSRKWAVPISRPAHVDGRLMSASITPNSSADFEAVSKCSWSRALPPFFRADAISSTDTAASDVLLPYSLIPAIRAPMASIRPARAIAPVPVARFLMPATAFPLVQPSVFIASRISTIFGASTIIPPTAVSAAPPTAVMPSTAVCAPGDRSPSLSTTDVIVCTTDRSGPSDDAPILIIAVSHEPPSFSRSPFRLSCFRRAVSAA